MKLPKINPRPLLDNYKQVYMMVGGTVIVATVITGGYFASKALQSKPAPQPVVQTKATTPAPVVPKNDGTYKGATNVVSGLANVTVNVAGTTLTGNATYNGTYKSYKISGPVGINGTVTEAGVVTANLSGSGTLYGESYVITGKVDGQLTGNTMTCKYSGASSGVQFSGTITLTKS